MHDRCALRNSGAAGSMPLPPKMNPNPPPDAEGGSGKFGTPCERMHLENLSCVTWAPARCAGLGAPPTNLTPPPPLDLDDGQVAARRAHARHAGDGQARAATAAGDEDRHAGERDERHHGSRTAAPAIATTVASGQPDGRRKGPFSA